MVTTEYLTKEDGTHYNEYRGLQQDPRPYQNLTVGDIFVEIETGKKWEWDGTEWDRVEYKDIPDPTPVINNVTSTSTTSALSANQGKVLSERMDNISNLGRYLAQWDCTTGKPTTNPETMPYTYKAGDYYRVGNVAPIHNVNCYNSNASYGHNINISIALSSSTALTYETLNTWLLNNGYVMNSSKVYPCSGTLIYGTSYIVTGVYTTGTNLTFTLSGGSDRPVYSYETTVTDNILSINYKPSGTTYNNVASSVTETTAVAENDVYFYDGSTWTLQINHFGGTSQGVSYVTTAPTAANTDGIKFVVLTEAPATKYDGWLYIIKES